MASHMTETGPRFAAQEDYRGHRLEVATGYSPRGDNWPLHAYAFKIEPDGRLGVRQKLDVEGHGDRMQDAIDSGLRAAKAAVDRLLGN